MPKPLNVLFVSSEVAPFAKVGGLADVVGSLPYALQKLGVRVRIIAPRYASIALKKKSSTRRKSLAVPFGNETYAATMETTVLPGSRVPLHLIDEPQWLSNGGIYEVPKNIRDPHYISKRFLFLSAAALVAAKNLRFQPDIIHVHDWMTAIICPMITVRKPMDKFFRRTKTLLTLHNIDYQEHAGHKSLSLVNLNQHAFPDVIRSKANPDYVNLLGYGIYYADHINTVSPTYAREILKSGYGHGLERIIRASGKTVSGILNGIDTKGFDPKHDPMIFRRYDHNLLSGKTPNKAVLQRRAGLRVSKSSLLVGMVSRLAEQKGINLLLAVIPRLVFSDIQFVILGQGNTAYMQAFTKLAARFRGSVSFSPKFDPRLAQQIYAGSDAFVMPSRFEPCGLGQMIAMRYGTLPVVRDTGGLHDTVTDADKNLGRGFTFKALSNEALIAAFNRAASAYRNPGVWQRLQKNAMKADFSWNKSAKIYLKLYKTLSKDA